MAQALEHYAAKQDILDLLYWRARAADRFDPPLMRACHPSDGTDNHGTYQGLMHGFIDQLEQSMQSGPPCLSKQHVIANALFAFRADGDVFVESYHVAHEIFDEPRGLTDYRIGGRYLDTFRRRDGRWLIQHRDIVYDWSRVAPAISSPLAANAPDHLRGARGARDPLYSASPSPRGALPASHPLSTVKDQPMDAALQRLLDKQTIAEILYRRARAGDRADAELAHSCYHPGATERHGEFDGLATDFIDVVSFTKPKPNSPIKGMFHLITNMLIEFADDTHAFCESYHVAWCQMTNGTDAAIGGRYFDKFERRDGRWAIAHRDVIFDWSRVDPETEKFWDKHPAKPFLFGKRGADDPLYQYTSRGA
ncbi:MAG TPA: nuclear transport factor 2 family protein [Caulobacterales bacterium]|nr:nuclear transport factor 2 family protein [Caulobacterales bacterium]